MDIEGYDMYYSTGEACFCNRNSRHTEILDSDCEIVLFMVKESLPIINQLIEQFTADHRSAQYFIKGYMLRLFLFLEEPSNYDVLS